MILIFTDELLNKKGACDVTFIDDEKTKYLENYENFFDLLDRDALAMLNNIYNYSLSIGLNRITTESWLAFLFNNNLKIVPIQTNIGKIKTNNIKNVEYKHKGRKYDISITKDNIYNENNIYNHYPEIIDILKEDSSITSQQLNNVEELINRFTTLELTPSLFEMKTVKCNNYTELLLAFLHCLLSSNKNYCIKKCEFCDKFYVAIKSDTRYCKRTTKVNKKELSCDNIVNHFKKSYDYKKFQKYNTANLKYFNNNGYSEDYVKNYKNAKNQALLISMRNGNLSPAITFVKDYRNKTNSSLS